MVNPVVNVVKTVNLGSLADAVGALAKKEVLVGIPAEHSSRQTPSDDNINNAELLYIQSHGVRKAEMRAEMQKHIDAGKKYSEAHSLYIQSHGSPLWHIPPRPVLEPSIEASKEPIAKQLQGAAVAAIDGNAQEVDNALHKAGMVAENAAKAWFENPQNGWPPNSPKTIAMKGSDSPLIDTGEMRKAITHVVRNRGEGE
jgi:hypothetical protein